MANNRLYLRCRECPAEFYLAKFFPSDGWYTNQQNHSKGHMEDRLDVWLKEHSHLEKGRTMYGHDFVLAYEIPEKHE